MRALTPPPWRPKCVGGQRCGTYGLGVNLHTVRYFEYLVSVQRSLPCVARGEARLAPRKPWLQKRLGGWPIRWGKPLGCRKGALRIAVWTKW